MLSFSARYCRPFSFGLRFCCSGAQFSGGVNVVVYPCRPAPVSPQQVLSSFQLHTSANVGIKKVTTQMWGVRPEKPMSEDECAERVLKAIRSWDRFPDDRADKLTLDARFVEDLSFDSLDLVEITMALEDEFGIEVEDDVAHAFKTPRDIYLYVADREMVFENEGL